MRKKRILFCGEATYLNTGYATYNREILTYLYNTNKYELAELSAYGTSDDPRINNIPWQFFAVAPPNDAPPSAHQQYQQNPVMQFGEFAFEDTCLKFKPDIVCDIRDFWMLEFVERSPFRRFINWAIMPTVDAAPQNRQWLATYKQADACFTYSDWAGGVLKEQSNNKINYIGSAPPSAHRAYQPIQDKIGLRAKYGIGPNDKIIGTVMRNQRRKLYPDLFEAFAKLLASVDNPSEYKLYCHTSYPDMGWNIPELLNEYKISSNVLFTYVCADTGQPFPSTFKGPYAISPYTKKFGSQMSSVKIGLSYQHLCEVMNLFDLYVQYANSEGFGLPQVEAAACGIPVAGTDYSAMETVIRKLEGFPIKPQALYKELETGCYRAVPDNNLAAKIFLEFFNLSDEERKKLSNRTRQNFLTHFQWHQSGKMWEDYFDSVPIADDNQTWLSRPEYRQPISLNSINQSDTPSNISKILISKVMCDTSKLNTFLECRLTADLTYKLSTSQSMGMYENDQSSMFGSGPILHQPFDLEKAYKEMMHVCNKHNFWEQQRAKVFNL